MYLPPQLIEVEVMSISFTTNKMRVRSLETPARGRARVVRAYDCDAAPFFEQNPIVRK
jgi:hypothetical protein